MTGCRKSWQASAAREGDGLRVVGAPAGAGVVSSRGVRAPGSRSDKSGKAGNASGGPARKEVLPRRTEIGKRIAWMKAWARSGQQGSGQGPGDHGGGGASYGALVAKRCARPTGGTGGSAGTWCHARNCAPTPPRPWRPHFRPMPRPDERHRLGVHQGDTQLKAAQWFPHGDQSRQGGPSRPAQRTRPAGRASARTARWPPIAAVGVPDRLCDHRQLHAQHDTGRMHPVDPAGAHSGIRQAIMLPAPTARSAPRISLAGSARQPPPGRIMRGRRAGMLPERGAAREAQPRWMRSTSRRLSSTLISSTGGRRWPGRNTLRPTRTIFSLPSFESCSMW